MMENLPDKFGYSLQIVTNPLGNVSGSNDFVYSDKLLKAKMNMEIPLSLIATNLTLVDTLDLNIQSNPETQNIKSGTITLFAKNGFPFDASIQLYMLDDNNNVTDSLYTYANTIDQAMINSSLRVTGKKATKLVAAVNQSKMQLLYSTKKVRLKVKFNTASQSQYVKIYSDYSIDIQLIGDINYTIQLK
jgi:predicted 3-demethylubiquinone-9 3-methyltransferase (glyoxalase superfamily)